MVALGSSNTDMYHCWWNLVHHIKVHIITLQSTIIQPLLTLGRLFSTEVKERLELHLYSPLGFHGLH